jgi:predicted HTH transcriptional regulator
MNKSWKIEENSNLDYKATDSLNKTLDSKKKEIAKDVSAMANSDGGKPMILKINCLMKCLNGIKI